MTTYLPAGTQEAMVNFQDDFAGFADNDVELVDHFSNFLQMCSDTNIKLNPSKVKVGVCEVKFYDYKLTNNAMHPAESNLDPIKKLTTPTNHEPERGAQSSGSICPVQAILQAARPRGKAHSKAPKERHQVHMG